MYIIKLLGLVGTHTHGDPQDVAGKYVGFYDPDGNDGRGDLYYFDNPKHAHRFYTQEDAMKFYRQQSRVRPLRPDGQPNRPLTAFTISIEPLEPGGTT